MLNVVIRSIVMVLIGVLLVMWREDILPVIVQCIGAAFIIPGVLALVRHFMAGRGGSLPVDNRMQVLSAVGSCVLGLLLLLSPKFFVAMLVSILGVSLLLLGLYQAALLFFARKRVRVSLYLFVMPLLQLLIGVFVLAKPFDAESLLFLLLGIGAIISGVSDLLGGIFLLHARRGDDTAARISASDDTSPDNDNQ